MTKEQQIGNQKLRIFLGFIGFKEKYYTHDFRFHESWDDFMLIFTKLNELTHKNITAEQRSLLKMIKTYIMSADLNNAYKYSVDLVDTLQS